MENKLKPGDAVVITIHRIKAVKAIIKNGKVIKKAEKGHEGPDTFKGVFIKEHKGHVYIGTAVIPTKNIKNVNIISK